MHMSFALEKQAQTSNRDTLQMSSEKALVSVFIYFISDLKKSYHRAKHACVGVPVHTQACTHSPAGAIVNFTITQILMQMINTSPALHIQLVYEPKYKQWFFFP